MEKSKRGGERPVEDEAKFGTMRPAKRKKDNFPLVFALIIILCAVLFALEFFRRMVFAE